MKFYVATKWEERARARQIMSQLIDAGHTITYDWTMQEQESGLQAQADLNGVIEADVLVFIAEQDLNYKGALIEIGAALGQGMPVVVIGDAPITETMFFKHPNIIKLKEFNLK